MEFFANTYEYLRPGGPVMIPLIFTSFLMWILIIERLLYFRQIHKNDISLNDAVKILKGNSFQESKNTLLSGIILNFLKERTGHRRLDLSILEQCVMKQRPYIRRFIPIIGILAAISPLFGLLGTVTGMITTFDVIAIFGTGNAKAIAGGISEAMITTQSGLLIAIPGLLMASFLIRRANRLESCLDEAIITLKRYI